LRHRLLVTGGGLLGLLALILILGSADSAQAGTFNPELVITMADSAPETSADFTADFNLPSGDVNFGALVTFIPEDFGIVPGDKIPIGTVVGELEAQATLGLINAACQNVLPVEFTMLNASIDPTDTVVYLDEDDNGTEDYAEDLDESGLQDGFEKYPDFITRLLVDEQDKPLQPLRRSAGVAIVAGINVLLQFLVFEPGTFIDEEIPHDASLGYPSVVLLQNAGDPDTDPIPGPITDFCTPLLSVNTSFGMSKDNPCTDDVPADELDALCEAVSVVPAEEGAEPTDPDEGGVQLFANPQDGKYDFTAIGAGQRDADDDGIENALDTCQFIANEGDPRINGDGDADTDGLDKACDPDDSVTNSDEDLDGYLNRGDNCPLDPNGDPEESGNEGQDNQRDSDDDTIGDACDPDKDDADAQGELKKVQVTESVTIGAGTGAGGPPSASACPNCAGNITDDGPPKPTDDGGGSSSTIIIIIAVIAAVVVLGGGAFFFMRGRGGGGAAA
jgi:hypothetical protein